MINGILQEKAGVKLIKHTRRDYEIVNGTYSHWSFTYDDALAVFGYEVSLNRKRGVKR